MHELISVHRIAVWAQFGATTGSLFADTNCRSEKLANYIQLNSSLSQSHRTVLIGMVGCVAVRRSDRQLMRCEGVRFPAASPFATLVCTFTAFHLSLCLMPLPPARLSPLSSPHHAFSLRPLSLAVMGISLNTTFCRDARV